MRKIIITLVIVILAAFSWGIYRYSKNRAAQPAATPTTFNPILTSPQEPATSVLTEPIADFKARIAKKPFGIYITPQNSPISPEKFTGFHTGVDVEYVDVVADVPIYAIADGTITLARTASGYGGVIMLESQINGTALSILYGHLRPSSLPQAGQKVKKGEQIGVLGTGSSSETDGERRHLHFAVLTDNRSDLRGYVENQTDLAGWLDPISLYQ